MKPLVLFLVGPTASGKSAVAVEMARLLGGEIISADSMQVYKGMDIGTAKPSARERKKIPHYLIDEISPSRPFSVYEFYQRSLKAMRAIHKKGKTPIVAGGTGLYVRSLLQGLVPGPDANPELREKLHKIAQEKGVPHLHAELARRNPERAAQLSPNDRQRIVRALEILEAGNAVKKPSCKPLSELGYEVRAAGLSMAREVLYGGINRRVDAMFRKGLVREARGLKKRAFSTAGQALGYKEVWEALENKQPLSAAKENIKLRTRHFAKRQLTWFRKEPGIHWVDWEKGMGPRGMAQKVIRELDLT